MSLRGNCKTPKKIDIFESGPNDEEMTITLVGKELTSTTDEERAALKSWIAPGFLTPLDKPESLLDPTNSSLFALIAYDEGQIAGLLIADFKEIYGVATIKSLSATSTAQRRTILNQLLDEIENESRKRKMSKLSFIYADAGPNTSEWDELLGAHDWYGKRAIAMTCEWENCRTFNAGWFKKKWPLPKGCEIVPWKKNEDDEPLNSLGLSFENDMVGWIETKRVNPQTLCYYKLVVDYPFRFTGAAVSLLVKSIQLQQESDIPRSIFLINYQLVKPRWVKFIRKRLVPFAERVTEYSQAVKKL